MAPLSASSVAKAAKKPRIQSKRRNRFLFSLLKWESSIGLRYTRRATLPTDGPPLALLCVLG
jgi:hypothetical protein